MTQFHSAPPLSMWRKTSAGAGIVCLALIINGLIFVSLPLMISSGIGAANKSRHFDAVDFIRVKKPSPPVRKEKPPETPKHKPIKKIASKSVKKAKTLSPNLKMLSFKLNTRLPVGAISMPAPDVTLGHMNFDVKDFFDVGELDQPLTPLSRVPPAMPLRARSRGIEGSVRFSFIVNHKGLVEGVQIVEEEPPNIFTASIMRAVSLWKFKPPTVDGTPVKTKVIQKIVFKIN